MAWMKFFSRRNDEEETASTDATPAAPTEDQTLLNLREYCAKQLSATVVAPDQAFFQPARFERCTRDGVVLQLLAQAQVPLRPQNACTIIFYQQGRAMVITPVVRAYRAETPAGLPEVEVTVPQEIFGTDLRRSFRIPVTSKSGVIVSLDMGDGSLVVTLVDISLGGVQLDIQGLKPSIGDRLTVRLAFQDARATATGEVRWTAGSRVGICFGDHIRGDEIVPPDDYRRVVLGLERAWLAERNA